MNNIETQFILEHTNDDIRQLALQSSKYPDIDMPHVIRQIAGRQKVKQKVPRFYENIQIVYPSQLSLEQSSSELTAKYKASLFRGDSFVDLTGGFGIDCTFIAESFTNTTYVERQPELCEIARSNFQTLGIANIDVLNQDGEKYLHEMSAVDLLFIDPARRSLTGKKVYKLSDCEPDVSQIQNMLLQKASKVMIKLSPMLDITQVGKDLLNIFEVHVISVDNECKEILVLLDQNETKESVIRTINFTKAETQCFDFNQQIETLATAKIATKIFKYLYEPNASVLKAGAFKTIGERFNLEKLHVSTHLYTSESLELNFPGRIFEVQSIYGNSKADYKELKGKCPKANITVRNFPVQVDELRKKTGIKDGGSDYIFASKMAKELLVLIKCKKIK